MRILWISALVIGLDQLTKAAVLQLMYRQQSIPILGDWLKFTFTENPGMAFGIQFKFNLRTVKVDRSPLQASQAHLFGHTIEQ